MISSFEHQIEVKNETLSDNSFLFTVPLTISAPDLQDNFPIPTYFSDCQNLCAFLSPAFWHLAIKTRGKRPFSPFLMVVCQNAGNENAHKFWQSEKCVGIRKSCCKSGTRRLRGTVKKSAVGQCNWISMTERCVIVCCPTVRFYFSRIFWISKQNCDHKFDFIEWKW